MALHSKYNSSPSIGEINEMFALSSLSKNPKAHSHHHSTVLSNATSQSLLSNGTILTNSEAGNAKKKKKNKKSQKGTWFACVRQESCKTTTSKTSPQRGRMIDEAFFIERAFVVESLPRFWADKYQPASLNSFICHKQEAQRLKDLVSSHDNIFPHILLKGPSGSGKKTLAMALLTEIYGDTCQNLSHDLRYFAIQEGKPMKVCFPIRSSFHHVELNVSLEPNAEYALMGLVKEISCIYAITEGDNSMGIDSDFKVILLYDVDKASQNIQHLIKWTIDRHSHVCKLVLCCEDDVEILEPVKKLFKVIKVDAPPIQEIVEVLMQIAKNEDIHLPKNFAAKIAAKSDHNLRKAIMALETCKAFKYPFLEDQPIAIGWEEILIQIASEILIYPSNSCLLSVKDKFQKLLEDFVHPKLILQKLVEELLKMIESSLKRELYFWHAYYHKRLPPAATALPKLVEFVAKFMSIYKKSCASRHYGENRTEYDRKAELRIRTV